MATISTAIPQQVPVTNPIPNPQDYNTNKGPYGADLNTNFMGQNYNLSDKSQFDAYKARVNATPTNTPSPTPPTPPKSEDQQIYDENKANYDQVTNDLQQHSDTFQKAAEAYANGSTPLSAGQQAQIQGLQQQFQQLIDNQKLVNTGAEGAANIRGYQKGSAEYDPNFQTKVIGQIFSAGQAKVADLQTKEAAAVANLTSQFQAENYAGIKGAWDEYQSYADKVQKQFAENMKTAQAAIAAAQDKQRQAQRDNTIAALIYNGYKDPSEILSVLNSNGADYSAKEVKDTIDNLISTQSYPGGDLGLYEYYHDQEINAGRTPLSLNDWLTLDANRKASIARAGGAGSGGSGGEVIPGNLNQLQQEAFDSARELYNKFINGKGTSAVGKSSVFGPLSHLPGTEASDFVKQFDNLKSLLSLDNVKYLKGQGAVSDAERQLLADSVSTLSRSQSEPEFKRTLENIINVFSGIPKNSPGGLGYEGSPEDQASQKVKEIYPQHASAIDNIINKNPNITNVEILQTLGY